MGTENQHQGKRSRAEALKEGQTEKAIETAKKMFNLNLTAEQIATCTGLSLEEVLKLQK